MHGSGRGHRLDGVVNIVESGIDDGLAKRLETLDGEADVVINNKDGLRATVARVSDICEHAVEGVGMEVAASHFDDGTESTIEGATARGLDHVHLAAHHGVAIEDARIALGKTYFIAIQAVHRARQVFTPAVAGAERQSGYMAK